MADVSAEPSMEDILASIKRIIAEEGDNASSARARKTPAPARQASSEQQSSADEVLELRNAMPAEPAPPAAVPAAQTAATQDVPAEPAPEPILSAATAEASRGALDTLSRLIVRSEEAPAENTLEGLVREMLRPMLREWLDARLPAIVEKMVAREISRITGQR